MSCVFQRFFYFLFCHGLRFKRFYYYLNVSYIYGMDCVGPFRQLISSGVYSTRPNKKNKQKELRKENPQV